MRPIRSLTMADFQYRPIERPLTNFRYQIGRIYSRILSLPENVGHDSEAWKEGRLAVVSRRGRFLYLPIPKAENTSIKIMIDEFDHPRNSST